MSGHHDAERLELLLDRALVGLSVESEAQLGRLQPAGDGGPDDHELAAAAVWLALAGAPDPMPAGIRRRVELSARELVGPTSDGTS